MRVKEGANVYGLHWRLRRAIRTANNIWLTHGKELVITSALDGEHAPMSWHYFGCAVDFRSSCFSPAVKQLVADDLRAALGCDFDVIVENDHIHVEYDPEKR